MNNILISMIIIFCNKWQGSCYCRRGENNFESKTHKVIFTEFKKHHSSSSRV